jgi:hypothetical protein
VLNLLLVHIPSADRTNERLAVARSQREDDEDAAPIIAFADCLESFLVPRVRRVGKTEIGLWNISSTVANDTPCLRHLSILPSSHSKPATWIPIPCNSATLA